MPLTFPSHAAAVLPLKLWRPDRFDGVALVIGSTLPDLPYAVSPYVHLDAHQWPALFWFCLPVGMVAAVLTRRAGPAVAAHLPRGGSWNWPDYGTIGRNRHRWYVTAGCVLLGALTHLAWDMFTHPRAGRWLPPLDTVAFAGLPWWHVLQFASSALGAVAAVAMVWQIGRRRLLVRHGPPAPFPTRPRVFWWTAVGCWVVGIAAQPLLAGHLHVNILGVRLLLVAAIGLVVAAAAVGAAGRGTPQGSKRYPIPGSVIR